MATTESNEKVRCTQCQQVMLKKNLKSHTKNIHPGTNEQYASTLSADIRNIFSPPPPKAPKTVNPSPPSASSFHHSDTATTSQSRDRESVFESVSPIVVESEDDTQILSQLQSLHLKVDRLEKQDFRTNIFVKRTDLSSVVKPENVIEILVTCRSVDLLLSHLLFFAIKNDSDAEGLYCTICECTLKYNFSDGLSFGLTENIPASFSHLKTSLKRHIQSSSYISAGAEK